MWRLNDSYTGPRLEYMSSRSTLDGEAIEPSWIGAATVPSESRASMHGAPVVGRWPREASCTGQDCPCLEMPTQQRTRKGGGTLEYDGSASAFVCATTRVMEPGEEPPALTGLSARGVLRDAILPECMAGPMHGV